jgi:hypothetical protein
VVGLPPATTDMPKPIDAYLIVNKETGVTESWHGILFYAKQNADLFNDLLIGKQPEDPWSAGEQKPSASFN